MMLQTCSYTIYAISMIISFLNLIVLMICLIYYYRGVIFSADNFRFFRDCIPIDPISEMDEDGMHMKSALVAISIIGLIVLIIHTIYTIKSISVGGTCDRGLHIVIMACTHVTKSFFAVTMAFLFVSIAAIDVSVCKEQPILMWLQPYIDLICRNFTVLPPSSEEPGAAESPKPDTVDQTTTEVPEFVGDCESATTELYNAYVCGFIILLCIDVLLFVQLPKNHCRVAPQPCNSSYCKSSCSKNTECSCCPKESKGTRLKKRLIKCIDYHRFRQCASMQSASSCSTIGPCGPGCTHGSCCGAGGAPCTQGDGPATCCASKPMIPGGPFTPAHGPGATYPIIPVSAKKSSMPAGPSCGGPSGGGPAPHGPGPGGPGPCGSGPGPHGPGGGPGPHGPAPGGAGGCGSSPGPHGPGPGGPGACGGGPPSHGPGPGGAGACGSGPASHGPAPGGAGACGGAPRPHGPGPGGPGACGGGPAPHGPGPHSGTPGGPHGGPHGPGPDHAGPHGGPHGGPYRPGPAGPFGGRPGPGNVGAHDIAGGGQSPCNPGQQSPGCQKSADPGPQGQSHPGESCNSKGPCAGEESPHGPNAEAPCDSKPCGLGVGGPSGPNRGGPCPEQADENISESNAPCDSGGASPAPLAGGGGSTQDDQKSIFSTQTTPRALMPPNSGPRSGMDPYNVKFSPSVRDSSSKAPFPSGPGPGHHNAASNFPGSPPDHRGHIVNNQYNTTANPKSGPPNTSFPPANTMRDQDPRNPSGGQYPPMHYNQGNRGPVPNPRTIGQYNAPPENVYDSAPASPQLPQPNTQRKCGGGMNNYQQETDTISKTDSDYYREKSPFDTSSLSESMYSDRPSLCPKFSGILSNDNDTSRCSEQIIATQMIIQDRTVAKTASPRRITEKKHLTIQENPVARKTSASNAGRKIQQVVNERSKCKDDMDVKISAPKTQSSGEMNPNKSPSCIVCLKPISSTEPSKSEIEDKERKLTEIACTSSQLSSQPTTMSPKESGEYSSTDTSRTATPKRKGAFKKTSNLPSTTESTDDVPKMRESKKTIYKTAKDKVVAKLSKNRGMSKGKLHLAISGSSLEEHRKVSSPKRSLDIDTKRRTLFRAKSTSEDKVILPRDHDLKPVPRSTKNLKENEMVAEKPRVIYRSSKEKPDEDKSKRTRGKDEDDDQKLHIREVLNANNKPSERLPAGLEIKPKIHHKSSRELGPTTARSVSEVKRPASDQPTTKVASTNDSDEVCDVLFRRPLESASHNVKAAPRAVRTASNQNKEQTRLEVEKLEPLKDVEEDKGSVEVECTCMKTDKGVHSNWQYRKFCKFHKKYTYY